MRSILILGGTGIVGYGVMTAALSAGWHVTLVSNNNCFIHRKNVVHVRADKTDQRFKRTMIDLYKMRSNTPWDVVLDVWSYSSGDAKLTYDCFKDRTNRFIVLSTTLVYDRSTILTGPIHEFHPLEKPGTL
jgi:nucleoside-diphosphate-sugar epimerase